MRNRPLALVTAALTLVATGALAAPAAQAAESSGIEATLTSKVAADSVDGPGVVARPRADSCYFDFKAYYKADRRSVTGSTQENTRGQVVRTSGNCAKSSIAKTKATVRISHTGIPPFGKVVSKKGSDTAFSAPFFANVARSQSVPTGSTPQDFHGPGTQITFDYSWRLFDKNGNYIDFCRRVTGRVNPTSVSKSGDSGLNPCGGGRWK